jgi:wobble nucleotide-excising tRNase
MRSQPGGATMINSISITGYKSFHPTTALDIRLDTAKQATFLYGVNGAGKTAIGEVIHGRYTQDPAFAQCVVGTTGTGPFRFLVYNHNFVQRVIGEAPGMPGIFTIGEQGTEKQREIEQREAEARAIEVERAALQDQVAAMQRSLDGVAASALNEVWKAHQSNDQGPLAVCLKGYGRDKKKFFEDLRTFQVPEDSVLDTLEKLGRRLADVSGTETEKKKPPIALTGLAEAEDDPIWSERITVSGASRLAPLIAKLGNGDWVGKGRPYIHDDQCPFCQQSLPHDFTTELAALLDGDRQLKIAKIEGFIQNYAFRLEQLEVDMASALAEPLAKETSLELAWTTMQGQLNRNLAAMRMKLEKPGELAVLVPTDRKAVQDALNELSVLIDDFNARIADRKAEHERIHTMFWQVLCRDRMEAYQAFDAAKAPLDEQWALLRAREIDAGARAHAIATRLTELRQQQSGVDASVVAINARLKDMGIDSFWIVRKEGEGSLYCLARPGQTDCSAQSLSEGEKTLISFLYFMQLLRGSEREDGEADLEKTIVVIDDPISSLSQNYVYDIASMIQHELIKPPTGAKKVRQVIVLTHNLFFLHELVYQLAGAKLVNAGNKCQLLRVTKHGHTNVVPMDAKDFTNDYDALWQVLRDARDHQLPLQVVPNTMRCILEHFFAFTGREGKFEDVLAAMSENDTKFKPLERYLNRGSHQDKTNFVPMDWGQYDLDYYLVKLRAVFKAAGFEDHYLVKMGEEEAGAPEPAAVAVT